MIKLTSNKYFKIFLYIAPLLLNFILILFINKDLGSGFINANDGSLLFTKIEASKRFFTFWTENNLG